MTGTSTAWLGVNGTANEFSFSNHSHNLSSLTGILGVSNGGTGVSSIDDLKTALGVSTNYTIQILVADYWHFSEYHIRVSTSVVAGIWYSNGLRLLVNMDRPSATDSGIGSIYASKYSYSTMSDLTTENNYYLLAGTFGIFFFPA